jgi:hypothetical protein
MTPIYIVMESNVLIAEDICGALEVAGPCQVLKISALAELDTIIDPGTTVSAAFLEMRYAELLESGLHQSILLSGAKIILTVGEDDEAAVGLHGWSMLVRPFTESMIHNVLRSSVREV